MRRLALLTVGGFLVLAGPALPADQTVAVGNDFYDPRTVTIDPGDTVTWRFDGANHDVKSDPGQAESFDSDPSTENPFHAPGDTFAHTFQRSGAFRYYCTVHGTPGGGGMAGRVLVRNPDGSLPDSTAPRVSSLSVNPRKFCKSRSRRCPRPGARLRFTLSEAARRVTAAIVNRRSGRTVKTLTYRNRPRGSNSIRFSGSGLSLGKYRLSLRATDTAGNTSSPKRAYFEIARSR